MHRRFLKLALAGVALDLTVCSCASAVGPAPISRASTRAQGANFARVLAQEKVIYSFAGGRSGSVPLAGPAVDSTGVVYVTADEGGAGCAPSGCGAVIALKPRKDGSYSPFVIHRFSGKRDAANPDSSLLLAQGRLFGASAAGDGACCGTAFALSGDGAHRHDDVLYAFGSAVDGKNPSAFSTDLSGNLYATTSQGGGGYCRDGCGVALRLQPSSSGYAENIMYSFQGADQYKNAYDGSNPTGGLTFDGSTGELFGVTASGGSSQYYGTVFELESEGSTYREVRLHDFLGGYGGPDGAVPNGPLLEDAHGNLFGTTFFGGLGVGTVFELSPNSQGQYDYTIVYNFQGNGDGAYPNSGLVADAQGNLYGTTIDLVYKLSPASGSYVESVVYSFRGGSDGEDPIGSIVVDSFGTLYGVTSGGGRHGLGSVYKIVP